MKSWMRSTFLSLYALFLCTMHNSMAEPSTQLKQEFTNILDEVSKIKESSGEIEEKQLLNVLKAAEQLMPKDIFTNNTMSLIEKELIAYFQKTFKNEFVAAGQMLAEMKKFKNKHKKFIAERIPILFGHIKLLAHNAICKGVITIEVNKPISIETKNILVSLQIPKVKQNLRKILNLYALHLPKSMFDRVEQTINCLDHLIDHVVVNKCTSQDKAVIKELSNLKVFKRLTQTHYEEIFIQLFNKIAPSYFEVAQAYFNQGKKFIQQYFNTNTSSNITAAPAA